MGPDILREGEGDEAVLELFVVVNVCEQAWDSVAAVASKQRVLGVSSCSARWRPPKRRVNSVCSWRNWSTWGEQMGAGSGPRRGTGRRIPAASVAGSHRVSPRFGSLAHGHRPCMAWVSIAGGVG